MNSISSTNHKNVVENKSQFLISLKKYLISPIEAGFYGFALVFSVILTLKLLLFLFRINQVFNLEIMDIMLSSVGFFLMYLIDIRNNPH
jgi:hypothetical protein